MANQLTGRIKVIHPISQIPSKDGTKTYSRRELTLDCTRFDPYTGERDKFENTPTVEFSGDRCALLDSFRVGQVVTVSFDLQGRSYQSGGETKYFTSVRGYKIESKQAVSQQPATSDNPAPYASQPVSEPATVDDLPFQ